MARDAKLKAFYNSKEWVQFRQVIIAERMKNNPKHELVCEYCNEPITNPTDAILHHNKELTVDNVDDATISLNPDNIRIVHNGCHNKIHHRFGNVVEHNVYLVYGAPMSGKTTYVKQRIQCGDLVVDMDEIYKAVSLMPAYDKPNGLLGNVFGIQRLLLDNIKTRYGKWNSAWIVGGYEDKYKREHIINELGAVPIFMEASKEECKRRLEKDITGRQYRKQEWEGYINKWFDRYTE